MMRKLVIISIFMASAAIAVRSPNGDIIAVIKSLGAKIDRVASEIHTMKRDLSSKIKEEIKKYHEKIYLCYPFHCDDPNLEAYYPFKGHWMDISHNHHAQASAQHGNNANMTKDYLTIDQPSYVKMPNIDISTGPWTMCYRIRLHQLGGLQYLLANFRTMDWVFLSFVDKIGTVTMYLRTNIYTQGADPMQDMITLTTDTSVLEADKWAELKFVWNPSKRCLNIYVDGKREGSGTVRPKITDMTLKKSNGSLTWGIKEDDSQSGTLVADIKDFYFYRKAENPAIKRYVCHYWTAEDYAKIAGKSAKIQGNYCENTLGFKWTQGDDSLAPGCGGCYCCRLVEGSANE